jgi:NAD-dependent DNA ligase
MDRYNNCSQDDLKSLLTACDLAYEQGQSTELTDPEYDWVKRIYNQRRLKTTDKSAVLTSISSPTGVGISRARNVRLPMALRSLDNIFYGEGDVLKWAASAPTGCGFHFSAKMDGISALYYAGEALFTRGDAVTGRNISHILPLLKNRLPKVPYYVRGELIINKKTFQENFQGLPGRGNARNSVAGALASIHHVDTAFLNEVEFIAYEIIPDAQTDTRAASPQAQFAQLAADGFTVAAHKTFHEEGITDETLAAYYADLSVNYAYDIDGIVVAQNTGYTRHPDKNPPYARAFKQALECLMAPSRVTGIEWNASSYGYLIPTVLYEPVGICGVTLARATGESARYIVDHGLGPGAEVEIIYHGKVNPRINQVFTPVAPEMPPEGAWEWIPRAGMDGEPIHIRAVGEYNQSTIEIKGLTRFLSELGVKNIGEGMVKHLYEEGFTSIKHLLRMTPEEIRFMGPKNSLTIPAGIQRALTEASLVTLMNSSGVFGRGLGERKLVNLVAMYPDIVTWQAWSKELIEKVDGFAGKTAQIVVDRMPAFVTFLADHAIRPPGPIESTPTVHVQPAQTASSDLNGKNVCLTGFRDKNISAYLAANGAKEQNTCTKSTDLLLIPHEGYENKKTDMAGKTGIPILTGAEFRAKYSVE